MIFICVSNITVLYYVGKRPFGVSVLYMGWDKHYGYQLYQSDPSGNYSGWKATCIGNNSSVLNLKSNHLYTALYYIIFKAAISSLKQEYKEGETTLEDAKALAIKVLSKTLDMTKLTSDKVEMATLTRKDNKTVIHILNNKDVEALIAEFEKAEAAAEAAKKEQKKA